MSFGHRALGALSPSVTVRVCDPDPLLPPPTASGGRHTAVCVYGFVSVPSVTLLLFLSHSPREQNRAVFVLSRLTMSLRTRGTLRIRRWRREGQPLTLIGTE